MSSNFRLVVLMCYTAIMPMEKKMKTFKGAAIGCLNSKSELTYISLFHHAFVQGYIVINFDALSS
jgi:hypothetical protein